MYGPALASNVSSDLVDSHLSRAGVTEFARILRIKSNDLYQPPGSWLRRNHVRWRLTNFMAAVIAEAAALMSSRRKAAADNEATMIAAVAVAIGASAPAASDAGAGEKPSLTTSADDAAVDISGSLSGAEFNPIWHRMAETVTDKERTFEGGPSVAVRLWDGYRPRHQT
jgi:hypothetical protein